MQMKMMLIIINNNNYNNNNYNDDDNDDNNNDDYDIDDNDDNNDDDYNNNDDDNDNVRLQAITSINQELIYVSLFPYWNSARNWYCTSLLYLMNKSPLLKCEYLFCYYSLSFLQYCNLSCICV